MEQDGNVRSGEDILAALRQLRRDPALQQHLLHSPAGPSAAAERAGAVVSAREQSRESLVAFQARWSREEEERLQQSLKAQRAFQQAMQSIAAYSSHNAPNAAEAAAAEREPPSIEPSAGHVKAGAAPLSVMEEVATMQEKLQLRDRTIQRLQRDLDETRAMYEVEIARMREAHAQSSREAERELAEMKELLTRLTLAQGSRADAQAEPSGFLDVIEFKERMLQELHDAFENASQAWKSGAVRTVTGMRVTAEQEIGGIVARAEALLQQLQEGLSMLEAMPPVDATTTSLSAAAAGRLLQEESAFMSSYEAKLREQVRAAVKSAVRARVKDVARPLVEHELAEHRERYTQRCASPSSPSPAVAAAEVAASAAKTAAAASPPPSSSSSPAVARYDEAMALFQQVAAPRREPRTPSQRPREVSAGGVAAALLEELSSGAAVQHCSGSDGPVRPPWLDRYCY
ncbi:hypothetical protein DQ04_04971030 [Trypanosoma grayi]|uniref:hypothetical protein n=1 Tax=Trypanosoma grayi TaxID=71804 RepID=UPI0004F4A496|nr:hypothetical protein DQ04_04971030 [Trypanosoma grayi]KEG09595.1 hypothetical protein DQ04_04971030 [Trypanosoma grayi]